MIDRGRLGAQYLSNGGPAGGSYADRAASQASSKGKSESKQSGGGQSGSSPASRGESPSTSSVSRSKSETKQSRDDHDDRDTGGGGVAASVAPAAQMAASAALAPSPGVVTPETTATQRRNQRAMGAAAGLALAGPVGGALGYALGPTLAGPIGKAKDYLADGIAGLLPGDGSGRAAAPAMAPRIGGQGEGGNGVRRMVEQVAPVPAALPYDLGRPYVGTGMNPYVGPMSGSGPAPDLSQLGPNQALIYGPDGWLIREESQQAAPLPSPSPELVAPPVSMQPQPVQSPYQFPFIGPTPASGAFQPMAGAAPVGFAQGGAAMRGMNRGIGSYLRNTNEAVRLQEGGYVVDTTPNSAGNYSVRDSSGRVVRNAATPEIAQRYARNLELSGGETSGSDYSRPSSAEPATQSSFTVDPNLNPAGLYNVRDASGNVVYNAATQESADRAVQNLLASGGRSISGRYTYDPSLDLRPRLTYEEQPLASSSYSEPWERTAEREALLADIQDRARAALEEGSTGVPLQRLMSVKEMMDLTGLGFHEAASLLSMPEVLQRSGVDTTGVPYGIKGPDIALTEAFSEDPRQAFMALNRALVDLGGQYSDYPLMESPNLVAQSGNLALVKGRTSAGPYLNLRLTGPSGQNLSGVNLSSQAGIDQLARMGVSISQEDLANIRDAARSFYESEGMDVGSPGFSGQTLYRSLYSSPYEANLPDFSQYVYAREGLPIPAEGNLPAPEPVQYSTSPVGGGTTGGGAFTPGAGAFTPGGTGVGATPGGDTVFVNPVTGDPIMDSPYVAPRDSSFIQPVGGGAAYRPVDLPGYDPTITGMRPAPNFGITPSGATAYSPYGAMVPYEFPALSPDALGISSPSYSNFLYDENGLPVYPGPFAYSGNPYG